MITRGLYGVLIIVGLSFVACASPQLSPAAQQIEIRNNSPDDDRYEYVGEMVCERGANFRSQSSNIEACRTKLRNAAVEQEADLVVVSTESLGSANCDNCVVIIGNFYRERGPGDVEDDEDVVRA